MKIRAWLVVLLAFAMSSMIVVACGGGGGGGGTGGDGGGGTTTYTVGGTVSGLWSGTTVTLQLNGASDLTLSTNGSFTFVTRQTDSASYHVTVKTHPSKPSQICLVTAGTGSVNGANVSNVQVACHVEAAVVDWFDTCDDTIAPVDGRDGKWIFTNAQYQDGDVWTSLQMTPRCAAKAVTDKMCTPGIDPGCDYGFALAWLGTQFHADARPVDLTPYAGIAVSADTRTADAAWPIKVALFSGSSTTAPDWISYGSGAQWSLASGLTGSATTYLAFSAATGSCPPSCITGIAFVVPQNSSGFYSTTYDAVKIYSISLIPRSIAGPGYTISGTVSGLTGSGLVLTNGAGGAIEVKGNGVFTFVMPVVTNTSYTVTVAQQPLGPAQNCLVSSETGTVTGANVTNVSVTCI